MYRPQAVWLRPWLHQGGIVHYVNCWVLFGKRTLSMSPNHVVIVQHSLKYPSLIKLKTQRECECMLINLSTWYTHTGTRSGSMPGQGVGFQCPGIVVDIHSKGITEDSSTGEWTLLGFSCKSWVCSPWTFSTKIFVPTCEAVPSSIACCCC